MEKFDFVAIGDITTDAFIRLEEPGAHCDIDHDNLELCMSFGDKIPYDFVEIVRAVGNSPNASVSASRLGLKTALVSNLGKDRNGDECIEVLKKEKISTNWVTGHSGKETNYHYVLWFEDDRTILIKHHDYERHFPNIGEPTWVYLSSIGGGTEKYHDEIADYLEAHPNIKVSFQPGTYQISLGASKLTRLYKRSEIIAVNRKEAGLILKTETGDIRALLQGLRDLGPKIALITDGVKGAFLSVDGKDYFIPIFPDPKPAYERTGAGDAFSSTFTSMLAVGKTPLEAFRYAPINSMSVVQQVGAQKGLLQKDALENLLSNAPSDFQPKEL